MPKFKNHSYRVCDTFQTASDTKGEVGVEIETIGKNLPSVFTKSKLWTSHVDHSVKPRPGETANEYVFQQPVGRAKVKQALEELHEEFKVCKSVVAEDRVSNSVHVHINAQQLSIQQVYTWLTVYFIFEELLVRWAGPHRVGNLFCLRARDAEGLIKMLADCAKHDKFSAFNDDSYRYAAVNVMALGKFGSLEFRALRGTVNTSVISSWIDTLLAIKDKSLEYADPVAVLTDFSRRSPMGFTNHIIPSELRWFMMNQPDFQEALYEGARLAQDFVFSTEWQSKMADVPKPEGKPMKKGTLGDWNAYTQQMPTWPTPSSPAVESPPTIGPSFADTWYATWNGSAWKSAPPSAGNRIRIRGTIHHHFRAAHRHVDFHVSPSGNLYLAVLLNSTGALVRYIDSSDLVNNGVAPTVAPATLNPFTPMSFSFDD